MSRTKDFVTDFEIGSKTVALKITYSFVPYTPARGPTYSCGGQPEEPPEVDMQVIQWSLKGKKFGLAVSWQKVEGSLFDLIADDQTLYDEICAKEYEYRQYQPVRLRLHKR
jgi:hypothetical protein